MKKRIVFIVAAMMAMADGGAQAAKVCVSENGFADMVLDIVADSSFCSSSNSLRKEVNGRYCWCKVSGTWAYKNDHYLGTVCVDTCSAYCANSTMKKAYCSTSNSSINGVNGAYCWCFKSGSWSYVGTSSNGSSCVSYCASHCNNL